MNTLTISNKKYVLVEEKDYTKLQVAAARKAAPVKKLTLAQGRKHAHKLIDKWVKEK
jgi:hypothetical protein